MAEARRQLRKAERILSDWLPVALWMAVIFASSSQPSMPGPPGTVADFVVKKTAHLGTYAILAILTWRALRGHPRAYPLALIIAVLYGISDEWHQSMVPPRDSSLRDVIIDAVGAGLGLVALRVWRRRVCSREPLG